MNINFFNRSVKISPTIDVFVGINIHEIRNDGIFIFHDTQLIKSVPSVQQHLKGIMAVLQLRDVVDSVNYTLEEYLCSPQFKSLLNLIEKNIKYYYLTTVKDNADVEIKTLWERCGYVGGKIVNNSDNCKRLRFFYSPLVVKCHKCNKYRKFSAGKSSILHEKVIQSICF